MIKINIKIAKILPIIGVTLLAISLCAGGFIFYAKTSLAEAPLLPYQYDIVSQSQDPILSIDQNGLLVIALRNTGSATWPINELSLNSIYTDGTKNRPSQFATSTWIDQYRVLASTSNNQPTINPGGTFTFYIPIQSPHREALYQELFQPYIGSALLIGNPIKWLLQVGNQLNFQQTTGKHIIISLPDQRIWAVENGIVVLNVLISSGKAGYKTPKGNYTVMNHIDTAYSKPYGLWMDYWMALKSDTTGFRGYGLHRLPFWKVRQGGRVEGEVKNGRLYTDGRLYEDYAHLGKPMSHGCVRLGLDSSRILYNWTSDGTPVHII